jgi:type IV pilus assembly protein PilC
VAQKVEEGNQLSTAMGANPEAFSPMVVNVVRIGETGGILDSSLLRLADLLERKAHIRKRIVAAIAYPVVVLIVAFCVLIVIMTFAVPKFVEIYDGQDAQLPTITKYVIAVSNFVMHWPIVYIPLIIIIGFVVMMWLKTTNGRYLWDKFKLTVPPLSVINIKIATARSTRTLGNLIAAGIPLVRSLEATAQTSENVVVGHAIAKTKESVEAGTKIEDPLRKSNIFPDMVVDMIAIGDESGTLDMMLLKIADIYEDDVDTSLKGLTAIAEPLLIVLLGFVVIIIALGMLLPYFNLVNVI